MKSESVLKKTHLLVEYTERKLVQQHWWQHLSLKKTHLLVEYKLPQKNQKMDRAFSRRDQKASKW